MIRASDLIGRRVRTESGQQLGQVHDLRASAIDGGWQLDALVVGRAGVLARMVGSGPDPLVKGDVVPWNAVTTLDEGAITVRDNFSR